MRHILVSYAYRRKDGITGYGDSVYPVRAEVTPDTIKELRQKIISDNASMELEGVVILNLVRLDKL